MNRPRNQPSIMHLLLGVLFNRRPGNTLQQTSQQPGLPQRGSIPVEENTVRTNTEPQMFERLEEYKAILEHDAQLGARRQYTNGVYVGLNTVFLTALGFLLLQSQLDTWWIVVVVSAITVIITPINATWRAGLRRYEQSLAFRYDYLREIEEEFRARRGKVAHQPEVGLFLRIKETGLNRPGNIQLEI